MTITPTRQLIQELAGAGYEVLDHLHRSRGFDVFDAWSQERHARCVVKTPLPDRLDDARLVRRLEQEGRLLRRLTHPHILRGYEVLRGTPPAVVTETLRGETLSHLLRSTKRLTPAEAAVLGLQLCSAVAYLHGRGYLHLDLKPSNIVVDAGRAVVIDLSVARKPGRVPAGLGTWCYLAPEQAVGGLVGAPADVWGIGAVLFEALVGEAPFEDGAEDGDSGTTGGEEVDVYPQLEARAPHIARLWSVPSSVASVVDSCLEPDPEQRPSLAELAAELEKVPGAGSPRAVRKHAVQQE
jgi:eukaryotic-like serine/threonine-protein kinase